MDFAQLRAREKSLRTTRGPFPKGGRKGRDTLPSLEGRGKNKKPVKEKQNGPILAGNVGGSRDNDHAKLSQQQRG